MRSDGGLPRDNSPGQMPDDQMLSFVIRLAENHYLVLKQKIEVGGSQSGCDPPGQGGNLMI